MEKKWYRVVDPINPLFGCDVTGLIDEDSLPGYLQVTAMRRVDIFVGDRPFQLVAQEGEGLGVMVDVDHLADSLLQDETVELTTERPYGRCIDESEMTRKDGVTLHIARYESSTQIAVSDADGELLGTNTLWSGGPTGPEIVGLWEQRIVSMFERGDDQDDIAYALRNN